MDKFHLLPPQASTSAQQVDWLFLALTLVMLFFMAVVLFPIAWFAIKYRRNSDADRSNPSRGSSLIEIGWTIFPIILSIALFCWGAMPARIPTPRLAPK